MINPRKPHAEVGQKLKNLKHVISHWGMPHSLNCTCYIWNCGCRWKAVFKNGWWHRLRPPADVVLDFHGGFRCQQQLGALRVAVRCCIMQRSGTSAPAEWRPASAPAIAAELPGRSGPRRPRRRRSPGETRPSPGGRRRRSPVLPGAALTGPRPGPVGPRCRGPGAGGPGRPGGRRWALRGRCRRLGARRNKTERTILFPYFLWSFCCL